MGCGGCVPMVKDLMIYTMKAQGKYVRNVWKAEMQTLVDCYKCEWKEVIENPEIRKLFNYFVNASEVKDSSVTFENMWGQKKVADWK